MTANEIPTRRIFGAVCFFPPDTDPNSLVAYKLLRNSVNEYDICSSKGLIEKSWAYPSKPSSLQADNVNLHQIPVNSAMEWVERTVELFNELSLTNKYDAILTWFHPVEGIEVAKCIKDCHISLPWVAMVCDPVGNDPDVADTFIENNASLSDSEKTELYDAIKECRTGNDVDANRFSRAPFTNIHRGMLMRAELEYWMKGNADGLAFCVDELADYVMLGSRCANTAIIPHSYDKSLYSKAVAEKIPSRQFAGRLRSLFGRGNDRLKTIRHIGNLSEKRMAILEPCLRQLAAARSSNSGLHKKIRLEFFGNVQECFAQCIKQLGLSDIVFDRGELSQLESLAVAADADYLLHIDLNLPLLEEFGGSIYFPSKLADYMGTSNPVLTITGQGTPSSRIVTACGGAVVSPGSPQAFVDCLLKIASGEFDESIDSDKRARYDANIVAESFDKWLDEIIAARKYSR